MNAETIERLPWDSEFFGVAIARSQVMTDSLAAEIAAARDKGIACLYLTVDALDTATIGHAVRLGATLTDLRIELSTPFSALADVAQDEIRTAGVEDARALADLSRELSSSSRFSRDPRFPRAAVSDMYALWIERCLREGVVVVPSGEPCGFVGARRDGDATTIDLVYITPEARGRNLAERLVAAAAARLPSAVVSVATQAGNIAAQRLYQRLGFRSRASTAVLHLWLEGNG